MADRNRIKKLAENERKKLINAGSKVEKTAG
jgi:hypothetical protein